MKTKPYRVLSILLIALFCIPAYAGQMKHADKDGHAKHKAMLEDSKSEEQTNVDVRLRDLELVTQDGKRVKFKSDVITPPAPPYARSTTPSSPSSRNCSANVRAKKSY
jgi:hypothetical protein